MTATTKPPAIKVRGIRSPVPGGGKYLLGRVSTGSGDVELVSVSSLASQLVATGVVGSPTGGGGAVVARDLIDSNGFVLDIDNLPIIVP